MKNIHILPTDKPSRLYKVNDTLYFEEYPDKAVNAGNQHIYITNDEEIKEGDWVIYNNKLQKSDGISFKSVDKKIILTTDQSLDGIQAIDDEFLDWFVQNANCDEVELEYRYNFYAGKYLTHYKIIIPKEETTAYHYLSCCRSIEECHCGKYPNQIKCYCGHTITCDCSPIDEPKDVVLGYKTSLDAQMLDKIEPKQETLEEAAERIAMTKDWDFESSEGNGYYDYVEGFTEGAKWQQERMYSEEDMFEFSQWISHEDWVYLPSKDYWVNEEQEELEQKLNSKEILNMWFEQNKKK